MECRSCPGIRLFGRCGDGQAAARYGGSPEEAGADRERRAVALLVVTEGGPSWLDAGSGGFALSSVRIEGPDLIGDGNAGGRGVSVQEAMDPARSFSQESPV